MIDQLKRFFSNIGSNQDESPGKDKQHDVTVAVCALFLEMGQIDKTFTKEEMETVISILTRKYGLCREHADALIGEADRELKESVDLWQFARRINDHYSMDEKVLLIERLWQVVYVDGHMNQYEHYLMNKLSNLLRLSHSQLIDAKLKVLNQAKASSSGSA